MKHFFNYFLCILSSFLVLSCSEELPDDSGSNTPETESHIVHFTASYDNEPEPSTKVAIAIDATTKKAKVSFTAGDYIWIWDGHRTTRTITLTEENINSDGSASFSVDMSSETGMYYALALDSYHEITPQNNVAAYLISNTFNYIDKDRIPHAAWAQCSTDDTKLSFKNSLTLFRYYTLSEDAETVTFSGNNNENVSGGLRFSIEKNGAASLYSEHGYEVYTSLVSKVTGWYEDCWFALPPGITFEKGFTLTVKDDEGRELSEVSTKKSFTTVAGQLWDLGALEGSGMTPFEMWQNGYSIKIGGVKYNKSKYGDAKLVEEGGSAYGKGVFFINKKAYVQGIKESGEKALYISNDLFSRAKLIVPQSETTLNYGAMKLLAFNRIEIETAADSLLFADATNSALDTLIFDNCKVTMHNGIINRTSASKYLKVLNIANSEFLIDIAKNKLDNSYIVNTGSALSGDDFTFDCITVKNNIFYSSKPREFRIIRSDGIVDRAASAATNKAKAVSTKKLYIENNTFYNVDNADFATDYKAMYRPFFMLGTVSGELSIDSNLIYSEQPYEEKDKGVPTDSTRIANILKCYFDTKEDNIVGKLSAIPSWYGLNEWACMLCLCTDGNGEPLRTKYLWDGHIELTENPYVEIDTNADYYYKKDLYYGYGAER